MVTRHSAPFPLPFIVQKDFYLQDFGGEKDLRLVGLRIYLYLTAEGQANFGQIIFNKLNKLNQCLFVCLLHKETLSAMR